MLQIWKYRAEISKTKKLYLIHNTETLLWELQKAETELWKEPPEPLLDEIAKLVMKDISSWESSATELVSLINVEIQPRIITRKLQFWKDNTETA